MWREVRVSARVLKIPQECACCNGTAETEIGVAHTRVTGVQVVRTNIRGWRFPYCFRCLGHVKARAQLPTLEKEASARIARLRASANVGGENAVMILLGFAVVLLAVIAGLAAASSLAWVIGTIVGASGEARWTVTLFLAPPFGMAAAAALGYYLYPTAMKGRASAQRRAAQAKQVAESEIAKVWASFEKTRQDAASGLTPVCCATETAVRYLGWQGSVHTFQFYNDEYARRFMEANRAKMLG